MIASTAPLTLASPRTRKNIRPTLMVESLRRSERRRADPRRVQRSNRHLPWQREDEERIVRQLSSHLADNARGERPKFECSEYRAEYWSIEVPQSMEGSKMTTILLVFLLLVWFYRCSVSLPTVEFDLTAVETRDSRIETPKILRVGVVEENQSIQTSKDNARMDTDGWKMNLALLNRKRRATNTGTTDTTR